MSYGMTYDEFWNGNIERLSFYRRKAELERERQNQMLWMEGLYIVKAIESCFTKDGKYPDKPYRITEPAEEEKRAEQEAQEKQQREAFHHFFDSHKRAAEAKQ